MIPLRFGPIGFCMWLLLAIESGAQQPKFLPLQPHKVQWANAVIKNALKTKDLETLVRERREKFAAMGVWTES